MNILRFLALGDKKLNPFNITHRFTHLFWLGDLNYRVELPTWVRRLHLGSSHRGQRLSGVSCGQKIKETHEHSEPG